MCFRVSVTRDSSPGRHSKTTISLSAIWMLTVIPKIGETACLRPGAESISKRLPAHEAVWLPATRRNHSKAASAVKDKL